VVYSPVRGEIENRYYSFYHKNKKNYCKSQTFDRVSIEGLLHKIRILLAVLFLTLSHNYLRTFAVRCVDETSYICLITAATGNYTPRKHNSPLRGDVTPPN